MTAVAPVAVRSTRVADWVTSGALIAWGLLHLAGGLVLITGSLGSAQDALMGFATGLSPGPVSGDAGQAVKGVVGFHGFNIAAAGVAVTILAWRSRRGGSAAAPMIIATIADVGLVAFLLLQGVMAGADGVPGLALLLVAAVAAAIRGGKRGADVE